MLIHGCLACKEIFYFIFNQAAVITFNSDTLVGGTAVLRTSSLDESGSIPAWEIAYQKIDYIRIKNALFLVRCYSDFLKSV